MKRSLIVLAALLLVPAATVDANAAPLDVAGTDKILALVHKAAGGATLDGFAGITQTGTFSQNGGAPNAFTNVVDLPTGHYKTSVTIGPATFVNGFDGAQWNLRNGLLSIVSLPVYVRDAVTQAYLNGTAFFEPAGRSAIRSAEATTDDGKPAYDFHVQPDGGSSADLFFDAATYLLVKVIAHGAGGDDTTTYSDYRTIQGVPTSMRQLDVDPAGAKTVTLTTSQEYLSALPAGAIARPVVESRGDLAAPTSVAFVSGQLGTVGHLVAPAVLGGQLAQLVFDSGAGNFLTPEGAKRLGLKAGGAVVTGGVGSKEQQSGFAAVPALAFGAARLKDQNFDVTALPFALQHMRKGVDVDGLLGYEIIANFRVTVRYADGRIDLAPFTVPQPAGGVTLPMKSDGEHAYVEASVDGVSGYFLLDTGNGGGVSLNAPFVTENHLFPAPGVRYVSPGGIGGTFPVDAVVAKTIQLAGVTFNDVPLSLPKTTAGSFAAHGVAGNFGARILSHFTIVFDYHAQTVTFIPNATAGEPFLRDHTGWSLTQNHADAFDVLDVVPQGPAATAGVVTGDRVVAFNGTPVSSGLGLGDLVPFTTGNASYTITIDRAGVRKTVTIAPRDILPAAQ